MSRSDDKQYKPKFYVKFMGESEYEAHGCHSFIINVETLTIELIDGFDQDSESDIFDIADYQNIYIQTANSDNFDSIRVSPDGRYRIKSLPNPDHPDQTWGV